MRIHPTTEIPTTNASPPDPVLHAEYPREPAWQRAVERMFRQVGWETQHFWNTMNARPGFPDLLCWRATQPGRVGAILFAELKTETGRVTPSQRATLIELAATGVPTYLFRPSDMDELVAVLSEGMRDDRAA